MQLIQFSRVNTYIIASAIIENPTLLSIFSYSSCHFHPTIFVIKVPTITLSSFNSSCTHSFCSSIESLFFTGFYSKLLPLCAPKFSFVIPRLSTLQYLEHPLSISCSRLILPIVCAGPNFHPYWIRGSTVNCGLFCLLYGKRRTCSSSLHSVLHPPPQLQLFLNLLVQHDIQPLLPKFESFVFTMFVVMSSSPRLTTEGIFTRVRFSFTHLPLLGYDVRIPDCSRTPQSEV